MTLSNTPLFLITQSHQQGEAMAKPTENTQYICVANIRPAELVRKLQSKFKLDFKVQVRTPKTCYSGIR